MKALQFNITIPQWMLLKTAGPLSPSLFYSSPLGTLQLVDIPQPRPINKNWALVKTSSCGFCGSDLHLIMLHDSPMASPFTSFPCIIGHEACGTIVEPGETGFKKGQRVVLCPMLPCTVRQLPLCRSCSTGRTSNCENFSVGTIAPGMFSGICRDVPGGFAEYFIAHKHQLFPIPASMSDKSAVLVEPLSVALQAIYDNTPQDSDSVCIIGCGVMGLMIIRAIRAMKIKSSISVIEPSSYHQSMAMEYGANKVLHGDVLHQAAEYTHGAVYTPMMGPKIMQGGFDRIFDTVGSSSTFSLAMNVARSCGCISLVGITDKLSFDPTPLWLKLLTIKGVYGYGRITENKRHLHIFDKAIAIINKNPGMEGMVTHAFAIDQYKDMIQVNREKGAHKAIKTAVIF